jgi:hypothetical protein
MTNLINGKTPEQIKIGLRCSGSRGNVKCGECAYCMGQFGDEDCNYECDQIDNDALALIEHLEAQQPKWVSVKERLPEEPGEVLITLYGRAATAWYYRDGKFETRSSRVWDAGLSVTHWMPLPEPPKEA